MVVKLNCYQYLIECEFQSTHLCSLLQTRPLLSLSVCAFLDSKLLLGKLEFLLIIYGLFKLKVPEKAKKKMFQLHGLSKQCEEEEKTI